MPSYLLLQSGGLVSLQGSGALLLQGDGETPASVGPLVPLVWRDHSKTITYREARRMTGRLSYAAHAEDPAVGVWWTDRTGTLIDYSSGYTFEAVVTDGVTALLSKTSGITGAAGAGTAPTGTPNIVITWGSGELNLTPGEYTLELTPTSDGRQRDPLRVPLRIIASAP